MVYWLCMDEMKLHILLFAGSAILFAETSQALQSLLNNLGEYCETRGVSNKKITMFEKG